jgi:hypothetical protein
MARHGAAKLTFDTVELSDAGEWVGVDKMLPLCGSCEQTFVARVATPLQCLLDSRFVSARNLQECVLDLFPWH